MKVKVAETAGFCFGVKRAVNKVYSPLANGIAVFLASDRPPFLL